MIYLPIHRLLTYSPVLFNVRSVEAQNTNSNSINYIVESFLLYYLIYKSKKVRRNKLPAIKFVYV